LSGKTKPGMLSGRGNTPGKTSAGEKDHFLDSITKVQKQPMMKAYNIFHCVRIIFLIAITYPTVASAADVVPLATSNQSPLIQIFGLPPIGNPAVLT
jgi:hypothetical protein